MSTITKLEVNLSERYIPPEPTPEESEEGSEEWCKDHLEDPRCEQYRPIGPVDPVDPTPEEPEEGSEEWCEIHTDSELCKEQEEDNEETGDAPDTGHHTIVSVGDNNNTPTSTPFIVAGAAIALLVLVACFIKFFKHKKEDKNHYYFKQQKGYKKAYATILPVLSLALIAGIFARVFAYNYENYPDLTASETLTIDNADIIGTDEIRYVKDTLVLPKSNYGYELYIHADDNKLVSDYNQGIYLDSVASTGALTENTFGYTFVNPATNPNTFERLSQTAERIITKAYSPEQTKDGISLDIWWGVNAKSAEEANYELEITYDLHEQQIITELQGMTPEICADMPTDHFESFIDIRNNKTYQVYKDDFGRCNVEGILTHDEGGNPTIEPISREQFPDLDPEESICPTGWHEVEVPATETAAATTGCVADYENIEVTIFDIDEDGNIVFNGSETIDLDDERCEGWTCTFIAPDQPEGAEPGQEFYGWSTDLDAETGEYQPGDPITIDSPNFALYPIWEKKTPKAILNDKNYLEFVYDYYLVEESKEPEYRAIYEPTLEDDGEIYEVYPVPVNATPENKLNIPSGTQSKDKNKQIKYINFDESFKDFEPTSTYAWFEGQQYLALWDGEKYVDTITNLQNLNTSATTDMSKMFSTWSIVSLTLPEGFGSQVLRTAEMFKGINSLKSLTLPEGFGSQAIYMEGTFNEMGNLQSLTLPAGFGSKATDMSYMFRDVFSLQSLTLPAGFGQSATYMNGMFSSAHSLTSLTLPAGFGSQAIDMSYMFYFASGLESLAFPSGFGSKAKNMHYMFYQGSPLQPLSFPAGFGSQATDMSYMFYWSNIKDITFPDNFGAEATTMSCMFARATGTNLILPIGFGQKVTEVGHMFDHEYASVGSFESVVIPSGFGAQATSLSYMFYGSAINSITLPAGFGSQTDDMNSMFRSASIGSLTLPAGFGQSATDMYNMFYNTSSLEHIYVPAGTNWATKTPAVTYSIGMFIGASKLPNFDNSRTDISAAHIGNVDGIMGYFTDVCEKDNSCGEVQGQQGQQSEQQPPLMSYSPAPNYSYTPISEQSTEESETETPVSTGEEKKSTKKSDTKSEQTEPLGVEKSVEKASTVDTATIAVIVASFVLVSAGAVIIFLIEKRRNEDEE